MKSVFAAFACVGALACAAQGQPWYARGDFNGWGLANPLTDMGSGHFSGTVTGLTPGAEHEYKLAVEDWSAGGPGSNGKVAANAAGAVTFHLYTNDTWADGWMPDNKMRAGYDDPVMHGWDIMGSFNGWSSPLVDLVDQGGGLYSGSFNVATPGTYEFKFRKAGDWSIAIGDDFGNSAMNNMVTTVNVGDLVTFDLDLPNGRWRTTVIPTPGAAALLALGGIVALQRKR